MQNGRINHLQNGAVGTDGSCLCYSVAVVHGGWGIGVERRRREGRNANCLPPNRAVPGYLPVILAVSRKWQPNKAVAGK